MEQLHNQSKEIGELVAALAKAQPELRNPHKNKTAKITSTKANYQYMYADLGEITDSYRLPLAMQGLVVLTQLTPGFISVKIAHSSGQWIESIAEIPEANDIKVFGANITYMRRYLTEGLIGLAAQEDIDGDPDSGTLSDQGSQYKSQSSQSQSPAPTVKPKDHQSATRTMHPSLPPVAQPKPATNYSPEVQPIVDQIKSMISEAKASQTEVAEMILEMGKPAHELSKAQWQNIYDRISKDYLWV